MTKRELYVGAITGVVGNILFAIIKGLMENSDGILDILVNILTAKIPLWYFFLVIVVACLIVFLMIQRRNKRLAFLKQTEEDINGFKFQWVWKLDEATGHYQMDDFWPICPKCGNQLRIEPYNVYDAYHCTNGHGYDFSKLYNIRRDLIHKLQREYKEYANMIDYPE